MGSDVQKDIKRLMVQKQKAEERHDSREVSRICNYIGELLYETGSYMEAICEHEAEKGICEALRDTIGAAVACRKIGECYCALEQYNKALQFQYQHLSLAGKCKDQVETQRALATIGRTYLCQAETQNLVMRTAALENAEKMFLKALDVCMLLTETAALTQTELMSMKGRLYLNLGLVWDARGAEKETSDYLKRALTISEKYSLEEEQYLCHFNLASMYLRNTKPGQALRSLQLALKLARALHSMAKEKEVLIQMAVTNVHAGNVAATKHCLKKVYRMSSCADESARIVKIFQAVVTVEEVTQMLESPGHDEKELFQAYEKLGDAYSEMGIYTRAITHYQNMLDCGKHLDLQAEQLIPVYVSLAQTHADNNQPDLAIANYHLELELRGDDHVQKCKTWLNIAEQEELRGDDYRQLSKTYMSAFSCAKKANNPRLQVRVLKSLTAVQAAFHEEKHLKQTQAKLEDLQSKHGLQSDCDLTDEESEPSDSIHNSISDEENDLNDLTSCDEDLEEPKSSKSGSTRTFCKIAFKVNEKGETPLHVACIKGNLKRVQSLLAEGHPVNVRDHCGWTPLHEAANHDHKVIVELLLDAGADINDRGGELCNGITPLIDAASCGNLDIVQLLVQRNANIIAQDNSGSTALNSLQDWYTRTAETLESLDKGFLRLYKTTLCMLQGGMTDNPVKVEEKHHHSQASNTSKKRFSSFETESASAEAVSPSSSAHLGGQCFIEKDQRCGYEDFEIMYPCPVLQDADMSATETYRHTMMALGSSTQRASIRRVHASHCATSMNDQEKPSLLSNDDYVDDDWLIDDMQPKKRKRRDCFGTRSASCPLRPSKKVQMCKKTIETDDWTNMSDCLVGDRNLCSENEKGGRADLGVEDGSGRSLLSQSPSSLSVSDISLLSTLVCKNKISRCSADGEDRKLPEIEPLSQKSPVTVFSSTFVPPPATRVRVKIEESVFLVPLPVSERKTISWLCEEASQRFCSHHGRRPILIFRSAEGAILSPDDIITNVLSHDEQLHGIVQGWDNPLLSQRYSQACRSLSAVKYKNISLMLKDAESSHILYLRGLALHPAAFLPVTKALQGQRNIKELHLPCNNLGDLGLESLIKALPDLISLQVLNLSCNGITSTGLENLAGLLKVPSASTPSFPSAASADSRQIHLLELTSLDISNNPLGFGSSVAHSLCEILAALSSLTFLSLSSCQLTARLFQHNGLTLTATLQGSGLQELDISHNKLEALGVELLLRTLKSSHVTRLNLGHTMVTCDHLTALLKPFLSMQGAVLQTLSLEGCLQNSQEEDLNLICRLPAICSALQQLNLSFNKQVTLSTLHRVLSRAADCPGSCLQDLVAVGCSITSPLSAEFLDAMRRKLECGLPLKYLTFSCLCFDKVEMDTVTHLWRHFWGAEAVVEVIGQLVSLSVKTSP